MLFELVNTMTKEEIRQFKLLAGRIDSGPGRVTLRLFDYLRKAPGEPSTGQMTLHLYGEDTGRNRNRLYAIRNKLLRELKKSMVFHHGELDAEQQAWANFLLARIYRKRGRGELSRKLLQKAMQLADKGDLFDLKELTYGQLLSLSGEDHSIAVDELIEGRSANSEKLSFLRESQNAMAYVMQALRKSNFEQEDEDVIVVLEQVLERLEEKAAIFRSPKGRIRLFNLTSNLLLQQNAFRQLEIYLKREYAYFLEEGFFDRSTHRTRIIMLLWLVNTTFKNYKFDESLAYCEEFHEALQAYNRRHYLEFILVYHNNLVNNYLGLGRTDDARRLLEILTEKPATMSDPRAVYLLLNLADVHFKNGQYRKALQTIARACTHDGFAAMSPYSQLLVYIFELVTRFEAEDYEFLETRITQVRGWYEAPLAEHQEKARFVRILEAQTQDALTGPVRWDRPEIEAFLAPRRGYLPGENEVIDYGLWLKSKKENRDYNGMLMETISANRVV